VSYTSGKEYYLMRRKLNVRLVLWSLAVLVPIGIVVHLLHVYQLARLAVTLRDRGDQAAVEGKTQQALTDYSRYLGLVPRDREAREKYARLFDRTALPLDRLRVVLLLQQLLLDRPDLHDVRHRLVENLIFVGRIGDAIREINALEGRWRDPAELKHLLGWCQEAREQYREAAESFRAALVLDPKRLESADLLAEVLSQRLHDADAARKVLDAMVAANSQAYRAYLIRSRFHQGRQDSAAVDRDLQSALALAPDEPEVVLAAARRLAEQNQLAQAYAMLSHTALEHPREPALYKAMADLKNRAGERATAILVLTTALEKLPRNVDLLGLHADLLIDQNDLPAAARQVKELRRLAPTSLLADYLQARIAVGKAQWPEATALLTRCRKQLASAPVWAGRVHALLGLCFHQSGDTAQEVAAFRQAVQVEPGWSAARTGLGAALLEQGRVEEAVAELQLARSAADPPPELWAILGRALLYRNQRLPESQRHWTEIESALAKAHAAQPNTPEMVILQADVLTARNDAAAARALLDKARQVKGPAQARLWCAQAELAERHGDRAGADRILDEAEAELGDNIDIRLARCRLWSRRTDVSRQRLAGLSTGLDHFDGATRRRLQRELAEALTRIGDATHAAALWQQIAAAEPLDVRSRFALVELAVQANQPAAARQRLAELRKVEGSQGTQWRFGTALVCVLEGRTDRSRLTEARKLLSELQRQEPDWGRLPLLEARADELEGRFDRATRSYERALERGEVQHGVVLHLVELLFEWQEYLRAEQALGRFLQRGPLTMGLARLGAEVAACNRNASLAQARAAMVAPLPSRDYRDYLFRARIDRAVGDSASAASSLAAAVEIAPHVPDTWIAYVEHLARTEDRAAADAVLADLPQKLPADRRLLTLARCHEALHDLAQAENEYEEALAAAPNDFIVLAYAAEFYGRQDRADRAEPLLRRLISPAVAAPADHAARARRQLAGLLAVRGAADRATALGLVTGDSVTGDSVADERVRLYIAGQASADRPRVLAEFQQSIERRPATPADRLLLAELSMASSKATQARDLLQPLATQPAPQPQHVARYADALIRTGDLDEAGRVIGRLARWEPQAPRTRALQAALRSAQAAKQ
jgi:tetratricopeptide (TPR) repeat protein